MPALSPSPQTLKATQVTTSSSRGRRLPLRSPCPARRGGSELCVLCHVSSHRASQKLRANSSLVSSVVSVAPANSPRCTELGFFFFFFLPGIWFWTFCSKDWKTVQPSSPMASVKEMCWVQRLPPSSANTLL